jgi:hypothetical protein
MLAVAAIGIAVALLGVLAPASADPFFAAQVQGERDTGATGASVILGGGPPVVGSEFESVTGLASASPFGFRAKTTLRLSTLKADTFFERRALAAASMILDDLVFTGPGPSVVVSFPLFIDGVASGRGNAASCCATLGAVALLNGELVGQVAITNEGGPNLLPPGVTSTTSSSVVFDPAVGFVASSVRSVSGTFRTTPLEVPTDVPLELGVGLSLSSIMQLRTDSLVAVPQFGEVTADAADTFEFATPDHIFDLPPGFTVNSLSGLIVDNALSTGPGQVPVPATLWLLITGVAAGACAGRARRARRPPGATQRC